MEIHRNTQIFAFQVHRECISLASRNGAVQMFFLTTAWKMFTCSESTIETVEKGTKYVLS